MIPDHGCLQGIDVAQLGARNPEAVVAATDAIAEIFNEHRLAPIDALLSLSLLAAYGAGVVHPDFKVDEQVLGREIGPYARDMAIRLNEQGHPYPRRLQIMAHALVAEVYLVGQLEKHVQENPGAE